MTRVMAQGAADCNLDAGTMARAWAARLALTFGSCSSRAGVERTELLHSEHRGPLRVQRLFHPDGRGTAHCYLLHPPGGVVLGDRLEIDVRVQSGRALLTTPSAGRFYTVAEHPEHQEQHIRLRACGGLLEWLPQETILFDGARARLATRIDLSGYAQLAWWDVLVLGKPACGEHFLSGELRQSLHIHRDGRPVLSERMALAAGDRNTSSRLALAGRSTFGTAVFTAAPPRDLLDAWLRGVDRTLFSVTQRGELLVSRYLGDDAQHCRAGFAALWRALDLHSSGCEPATPRIWHT